MKKKKVICPICRLSVTPMLYAISGLDVWLCPECHESVESVMEPKAIHAPRRDKMIRTAKNKAM